MYGGGNLRLKRFTRSISDKILLKQKLIEKNGVFSFRRLNGILANFRVIDEVVMKRRLITLLFAGNRPKNAAFALALLTLTQGN